MTSVWKRLSALLLLCLPAIGDQDARISVDVNLVVLPVTVTDQKGRFVSSLHEGDFQVYEGGVAQEIKTFAREDVPITAGIVVDHSSSMRRKIEDVSAATSIFARASNPRDQIFVLNFNEHVERGLPDKVLFTDNPRELERAISGVPARGMTALYDAVATGLQQLRAGTREKKVLIVVSDGGDNASMRRLPQVLRLAEQSTAIIYAIGIFDGDDPDRNPRVLRRLSAATGGVAFFPKELSAVTSICTRIASEIRSQYSIGYTPAIPAKPGEYRTVKVVARASHQGKLNVRTRAGYRARGSE